MSDCDCCEGLSAATPVQLFNRPGLDAVAYRIGTHPRFRESLLARLTTIGLPALADLRTREEDDFSIALLDAWATVADVLTFYQERIANESYLRTATERLSLRELARLIGYNVRPGVAASVYLAFTLETAQGAPSSTTIDVGTRVQSIPNPGEQAQTFETIVPITAYRAWNAMRPRLTKPQTIATGMSVVRVAGTATNLGKGDALVIVAAKENNDTDEALRFVASVAADNDKQETVITLQSSGAKFATAAIAANLVTGMFAASKVALNNSFVQNDILNQSWALSDLQTFALQNNVGLDAIFTNIKAQMGPKAPPAGTGVFAMRKRASLFGYNAPDWLSMANQTRINYGDTDLNDSDWSLPSGGSANQISLDQVYKEIQVNDWVAVTRPGMSTIVARVLGVAESAQSRYAISGKVTQLTLDADVPLASMSQLRQTTVYVQSEELPLVDLPDTSNVTGIQIALDEPVAGFAAGQAVAVTGERSDLKGVTASEVVTIADVSLEGGYTTLQLVGALEHSYVRDSVRINGNVALGTHGETTREILGSGDASRPYQQFQLKQAPLTHISAANETGTASSLQVYVNDVRWHERDSLYGAGPRDRIFITRTGEDSKTTVEFGDGATGARPPTGTNNIRATYRKGIGEAGNVKAGQASLLLTRPLGVKEVTNPLPASGGDDTETPAGARTNAPLTVLTLGRIVSLQDYEDFARSFAGVGKALATWTWDGEKRGIFVTIAGPGGAEIDDDSTTYANLLAAMKKAGDPYIPLRVQTYRPALFTLDAGIKIDPDYTDALVLPQIEQKLRQVFSFDARAFGQPVALSQIVQTIHSIAGVVAVDVNALYRIGAPAIPNARLAAAVPRAGTDGFIEPAELLMLDPRPVALTTTS